MINILTADMLKAEQLAKSTPPQNLQNGRDDYEAGRATIDGVSVQSARIKVRDHKNTNVYDVAIWLHSGQIALTCTCRDSYQWYLCRHRVAGFLALHDYLKAHPPKVWKAVLEQAQAAQPRRMSANYGPLVFSLHEHGSGWAV